MMSTVADIHHGTCSSQQAAAAWAWLQHGGGTCITPRRAEGLMASNVNPYKGNNWSRPSRFKMERMRRGAAIQEDIAAQHSRCVAEDSGAACTKGPQARRRHSFHVEDLAGLGATVGSFSSRNSATVAASATWSAHDVVAHDSDDQNVMKGHGHHVDEASSLLDNFELEAVWRQLQQISTVYKTEHRHPAGATAQKADMSPPPELKPHRRLHRSIDDLSTHKSRRSLSSRFHHHHHHHHDDDQHAAHHHYGHLLHQLLRFRSGRSPAYCCSIATVNSIVDHHQSASPKKFRAHAVNPVNVQKPSDRDQERSAAADQLQEKERSASSSGHRRLQEPLRPQLLAGPATRHHSYSKLFQSLIQRLPHSSHISYESASSRGKSSRSNLHFHDHQHFHHHHHHYHLHHHQLHGDQQHAAADALLHLEPLKGKDFVSVNVKRSNLYSLHKLGSAHADQCARRECRSAEKEGGHLHPADINEAERRKSRAAASIEDEY